MTYASVAAVSHYLPPEILSNEMLESEFEEFTAQQIEDKTGIRERHISSTEDCASDLALAAAERMIREHGIDREQIDALVFCTQTPDFFLPTTACLLQSRLGLSPTVAAFDFNLGCSGYVYGLGIAKGLIETGQSKCLLFLTADTYSKMLHRDDRNVRSIFGDAGAATLLVGKELSSPSIGPFVYGTDGEMSHHLIAESGGFRNLESHSPPRLFMDGPQIFHFTLVTVPKLVQDLLDRSNQTVEDIDLFVFHQANRFMLEHLRDKIELPSERFLIDMENCGNTVSSTIPIALSEAAARGDLKPGMKLMLVGFGVGLSWGATLLTWQAGD